MRADETRAGLGGREGGDIQIITVDCIAVRQRPTQHCKAPFPPLKNKFKKVS